METSRSISRRSINQSTRKTNFWALADFQPRRRHGSALRRWYGFCQSTERCRCKGRAVCVSRRVSRPWHYWASNEVINKNDGWLVVQYRPVTGPRFEELLCSFKWRKCTIIFTFTFDYMESFSLKLFSSANGQVDFSIQCVKIARVNQQDLCIWNSNSTDASRPICASLWKYICSPLCPSLNSPVAASGIQAQQLGGAVPKIASTWRSFFSTPACSRKLHRICFAMDIANLHETHASLTAQIAAAESQLAALKESLHTTENLMRSASGGTSETSPQKWPLLEDEYKRYGRQMIVSQIGLQGM